MHSYKGEKVSFQYDGGFDGEVYIVKQNEDGNMERMIVQAQDLIDFIAHYVRQRKIAQLESASSDEILGIED